MRFVIWLVVVDALAACGGKDPEAPVQAERPPEIAPAREGQDEPPRPRSEPPPRPPPPAGIKVWRRDAVALALSGDGRFLAAGDLAGQALLWDLQRERFLWADPTPEGNRLGRVVFATQAPLYLIGAFHEPDRPWRLWSAEALERRAELGEPGWIGVDAAMDASGARAVTLSSSRDGLAQRLELWDLAAPRVLLSLPIEHASRGAVAIDRSVKRVAVADDLGGVTVFELGDGEGATPLPIFESRAAQGADADKLRVSRVALSAGGEALYGAVGARLMMWSLGAEGGVRSVDLGPGGSAPDVAGAEPASPPIRGLHRVARGGAEVMVAITRPVDGGLVMYDESGAAFGYLDTGCRCEIHALSADGQMAACGCVEASELRWGRVRGP